MKIVAIQPLFQFGVSAYKGQEVEVSDKLGKDLVSKGWATGAMEDVDLSKLKLVELQELCSEYPLEEWGHFKKKVDVIDYINSKETEETEETEE